MDTLIWTLLWLGSVAGLAIVCSLIGRLLERRHVGQLRARSADVERIETTNLSFRAASESVHSSQLIIGSAVFTVDYLQKLIALVLMLFGGRIRAYERLLRRARSEAFIRLREEATACGADCVINVRFETSTVSLLSNPGCIEILSYGTALVLKPKGQKPYNFLRKGNE